MIEEEHVEITDPKTHRTQITEAILTDDSLKKIILAGPGTGKSFLFQKVCEKNLENGKRKNLVLTFINELVDDLSKDMYNLAEVKTLHSFAMSLLPGEKRMFINLGDIIKEDYKIAKNEETDFNKIFCKLIDDKDKLEFYSCRRKYYNFFSPNCSIYTLLKIFETTPTKIPRYSQILVDEYQDFNQLESKLIEYLSLINPTLLVGDDDQSLYEFKYANPDDIRKKYTSSEFKSFSLPYCSRCPRVTVNAFSNFVSMAISKGFLKERVKKEFKYFPSPKKDDISEKHNKIIVKTKIFQNSVAYNIESEITKIFEPRIDPLPSILIVCTLKSQIEPIEYALRKKGFKNIDASQKSQSDLVIEGLELLLEDAKCNLGWRIIFHYICKNNKKEERFHNILNESISSGRDFIDLLELEERKYIKKLVAVLRKIRDGKGIEERDQDFVIDFFKLNSKNVTTEKIKSNLLYESNRRHIYKNTHIKIVTILGSKGLTTDYAFLVNFDDKYLLDNDTEGNKTITDVSICKFLVALTRAKNKTYIYTTEKHPPTYVNWLGKDNLEIQTK